MPFDADAVDGCHIAMKKATHKEMGLTLGSALDLTGEDKVSPLTQRCVKTKVNTIHV